MAVDKVKPIKIETPESGTELDFGYTEIDPNEDYVAARGISYQNSNEIRSEIIDGEVGFVDPVNGSKKVGDMVLKAGALDQISDRKHSYLQDVNSVVNVKHVLDDHLGALLQAAIPVTSGNPVVDTQSYNTVVSGINSCINTIRKNQAINSLEIQALKATDINSDLSFFVDSFDNDDLLDSSSANHYVNEVEGTIGLNPGGDISVKDTAKSDFDQGTFSYSESFLDVGGDGAIRKEKTVEGDVVTIKDFDVITDTPDTIVISQTTSPGKVFQGDDALEVAIDFSDISLTEIGNVIVDLGSGGYDLSPYSIVSTYTLKPDTGPITGRIIIEDTLGATYTYSDEVLVSAGTYQKYSYDLTEAFPSIDETSVRYITFQIEEQAADQVILDIAGGTDVSYVEVADTNSIQQTFRPTSSTTCNCIKIRARWEELQPTERLHVGLANYYGDVLAGGFIEPTDATTTFQDFYVQLDNTVDLLFDNDYQVVLESKTDNKKYGWEVRHTGSDVYADGDLYSYGVVTTNDLYCTLLKPPIVESIYLDNFELEAESTYQSTATFTSRAIDFGVTPNSLDTISFTETGSTDTVEIRVRFASTEAGLSSATWSSWYISGQDISALTPYRWAQYQIGWSGGTSTNSNIVEDVTISYVITPGTGSATVISSLESTLIAPSKFSLLWNHTLGSGTINYYVSRDGKVTWQSIPYDQKGDLIDFTSGSGTQIHAKAIITGDAKLYGWALCCDEEFI